VKRDVTEGIRSRFDMDVVSERSVEAAVQRGRVRLFGKDHDVADLVTMAQRQLGRGAELEHILFVGGGTVALAAHIRDWFVNQAVAEHPAFANARGMLKYLRYVCDASNAA